MPKKTKKSKGKRLTLKKKYKILKKVGEHRRKKRLILKTQTVRKKELEKQLVKDSGIPSKWPMKDELTRELRQKRLVTLAAKHIYTDKTKAMISKSDKKGTQVENLTSVSKNTMKDQISSVICSLDIESKTRESQTDYLIPKYPSIKQDGINNIKDLGKVVHLSDIIIEVLDARDPLSCRSIEVEKFIHSVSPEKHIILLLNKVDLVPREVVKDWLEYFRKERLALAFACITKTCMLTSRKKEFGINQNGLSNKLCPGVAPLMHLLKSLARKLGITSGTRVGIIGLPNVGKSSLINSLMGAKIVEVGKTPLTTKTFHEVQVNEEISLIDSPGIIVNSTKSSIKAVLRGDTKIEYVEDIMSPVEEILKRVPIDQVAFLYKIPGSICKNTHQLMSLIAKSHGKLHVDATPDLRAAARVMLTDWNNGKIFYFNCPPKLIYNQYMPIKIRLVCTLGFKLERICSVEKTEVIAGINLIEHGHYIEIKILRTLRSHNEVGQD
jgi:nuclear GTP-binding protein